MSALSAANPKVVILGTESEFSAIVVSGLVEADVDVRAFVAYDTHPDDARAVGAIPVVVGGSGPAVAIDHNVPVFPMRSIADDGVYEPLRAINPDVLLVACFPLILPPSWLQLARQMALNLHPSLLPSYRGPTPLYWQLREGERETGITLHHMQARADAGDIVGQSTMPLRIGASFSEVNAELAAMGVDLAIYVLDRLKAGYAVPPTQQDEVLSSYQPFPKESDFRFDTHFGAERAYRFIEGTREWGMPFEVDVGDEVLIVERALDYYDDAQLGPAFQVDGERVKIRFSDGTLEAIGHPVSSEKNG